jgi:peroxiredoxin Q/BCP
MNLQILGISADQSFSQKAFSDKLGLDFPLLSDRDRKVIKAYGVYDAERDSAQRAYVLISKEGKILWQHVMDNPKKKLDTETLMKHLREHLQ